MAHRVIFVTPELEPLVPGGAGSAVSRLARGFGSEATVILAAEDVRVTGDERPGLRSVPLAAPDGSMDWYLERSRLMAEAVADVVTSTANPDLVEFTDFEACAWWALTNRVELGLEGSRIGVRLHGPVEAITAAVGARPHPLDVLSEMERDVFAMADAVLVPSEAVGNWARERYGIESTRILVAPPPVPQVTPRIWTPSPEPVIAHFGRLTEAKGVHDLIAAMRPVFDAHPRVRLTLIGPDGWSLEHNCPMSQILRSMLEADVLERVEFTGRLDRDAALERLMRAWAVVLPSRFESFCLVAHEARRAGAPLIVPDLPAFDDFDETTGALKYDGSRNQLTELLDSVVRDLSVMSQLAERPAPIVGDAIAAYSQPLPPVRHTASQSALATRASHRLEGLLDRDGLRRRPALQRLLSLVPGPLAEAGAALLPKALKDWFRARASWWDEQQRRDAAARRAKIEAAIGRDEFTELQAPAVTVVITCYNQGRWVDEAVLSVFEQSEQSWEIILVDDGSTDPDTRQVLDVLAEWPRVRLLRQANSGLPAARNAGMREARGEFLVPLDADDELEREYLAQMIPALEGRPDAAFSHCWGRYFGTFDAYWLTRPYNPYQMLLSNSVLGCALIRAETWRSVEGYDESLIDGHEDWDLWLRFQERGWSQVQVRQPLFRYRMRGRSMSVDTLSVHERGRLDIADRHPLLYEESRARKLKAEWYPWITILSEEDPSVGDDVLVDSEVVTCARDERSVEAALAGSHGKFVVEWDLLASPHPGLLGPIAEALERNAHADRAVAGEVPVAWRRWALHDVDADPTSAVEVDVEIRPDAIPLLHRGVAPDPNWMIPDDLPDPGLRIIRQRPEEEGELPDWVLGR